MHVGIVAQQNNERARELGLSIAEALEPDVSVRIDDATAVAADTAMDSVSVSEMAGYSLIVSIGGDGTFLFVARNVGTTPVLGVNLGEVGFLNAVSPDDALETVRAELEHVRKTGDPRFREVPRIEARAEDLSIDPGLNEIVIQGPQRGPGRGIDLEVRVEGSCYFESHADGAVVATQTGSTAYNLSEGGPILHSSASGLVVTPMCVREQIPPLVVGGDQTIEILTTGDEETIVASDGRDRQYLDSPASVEVRLGPEPARIAGPQSDFFEALEKIE